MLWLLLVPSCYPSFRLVSIHLMSPVPFHRRVLLCVFVLLFVVLAPAAIFYTAGYRWNPKKGVIERNGTLILDTDPAGAKITLNGEPLEDQTPVTLQNVTPGTYRIRLEYPGYTVWEKTLDVRPERVTFVNDVRLWRQADPVLEWETPVQTLAAAPNGRALAWVERVDGSTRLVIRELPDTTGTFGTVTGRDEVLTRIFLQGSPTGTTRIVWNQTSSAVLVRDVQGHAWMADRAGLMTEAERLAEGFWRWDQGTLIGLHEGQRTEVTVANGSTRTTMLPRQVIDEDDVFQLVSTTGTSRLSVVERGRTERRFELPGGAWKFVARSGDWLFLTDEHSWLGFDPESSQHRVVRVPADEPPSFLRRARETALLAFGGGELWFGLLGQPAELLLRLGEGLRGAAWHREGNHVFYATEHQVSALGLDPRDGRFQAPLATFDRIISMVIAGETVYVAGTRDGRTGVWMIAVE